MIKTVLHGIDRILQSKERVLIAIDGRCASGKTTLADKLNDELICNVIHMDDFFLRPEQRTDARYGEPGGNVDRERFSAEVLQPWLGGKEFSYRPFDCRTMTLGSPITVKPNRVTVIEGTYSCHPELWEFYDLHIFLTAAPEKQLARLAKRKGANIQMFRDKWIPLEEKYFAEYAPQSRCELVFET